MKKNKNKLRVVKVNDRGQIVIPEDVRKDMHIKKDSTLILIEEEGMIILKKEKEVLQSLDEEKRFWRTMSLHSMSKAWDKEDEVWEKYFKEGW